MKPKSVGQTAGLIKISFHCCAERLRCAIVINLREHPDMSLIEIATEVIAQFVQVGGGFGEENGWRVAGGLQPR